MKITIYELIGLVKDGKAPKKIKFGNMKLKYNEGCKDYYLYYGKGLFEYKFGNCKNFLNDKVEIIEELKKIEKLPYYSLKKIQKSKNKDEWYENRLELLEKRINDYHNKINELMDEINNLKENK